MEAKNPKAKLTTVAVFPKGINFSRETLPFVLILSSRHGLKTREMVYVPPESPRKVAPMLLLPLDYPPIVWWSRNRMCSPLALLTDMRDAHIGFASNRPAWLKPGQANLPRACPPNVSCLPSRPQRKLSDRSEDDFLCHSFASRLWRVDLSATGAAASSSIWLKHYSMLYHGGD